MARYRLELEVAAGIGCTVSRRTIKQVLQATLQEEQAPAGASVWVRITDDAELAELNEAHRGIAGPTDVLSFPAQGGDGWINPPGAPLALGDIIISWPRVVAQAAEEGHSPADELGLLLVHGCLHLLGYDHLEPADKERMWARQEAILAALGIHLKID